MPLELGSFLLVRLCVLSSSLCDSSVCHCQMVVSSYLSEHVVSFIFLALSLHQVFFGIPPLARPGQLEGPPVSRFCRAHGGAAATSLYQYMSPYDISQQTSPFVLTIHVTNTVRRDSGVSRRDAAREKAPAARDGTPSSKCVLHLMKGSAAALRLRCFDR